jgi:hypothetical protein
MLISIPPKYTVSQVVGFIKGKSAIYIARVYGEKKIFRWPGLLGSRVFRVYRRGRNRDPGIHQEPGGGRRPFGATESFAFGHLQVAIKTGVASATPPADLSGSRL